MMHMTFYWGSQVTILFDEWKTKTWAEYSITLLAVFLFAVFHEYIVNLRSRFIEASKANKSSSSAGLAVPLLGGKCRNFGSKLSETILFGVNVGLGYLLMLAVMSFNGGVFIAIVLGFIIGYFFFRSDANCQEITANACGCA